MLRHTNDLKGFKLDLPDEELGRIKDFYFDDMLWTVRYVVADTGRWLPRRKVLISPASIEKIDEEGKAIKIRLSKEAIEKSPAIFPDQPFLRKEETILSEYYNWPPYWENLTLEPKEKINLRSAKETMGYAVEATDGEVGVITNFIIDDLDWTVRYIIVDTRRILPGRKILLALDWIDVIDEVEKKIIVSVNKDLIESAPQYSPENPMNRAIETELFDFYKKEYYWK